jgi:uncharacterized protein
MEPTQDLGALVRAILADFPLRWDGVHGIGHWGRVLENGLLLCRETGADAAVVELFAVFHDSRRYEEGEQDHEHGRRGAELAAQFRGKHFQLDDERFALLSDACIGHTQGATAADMTVQTCWDADRLDLGRVGIWPDPARLCTEAARQTELFRWASRRGAFWDVPRVVRAWGFEMA